MSETPGPDPNGEIEAVDMLTAYSAALDEVYALRRALAYEAKVVEAQTLDLKALGKGRRSQLEQSIERMQQAARGESERAYAGTNRRSLEYAMKDAGGTAPVSTASQTYGGSQEGPAE